MNNMPLKLRLYTGVIILTGLIFLCLGVKEYHIAKQFDTMLFFIVFAIITESFRISLKEEAALSGVFTIGLAAVLIFDPFVASIVTAVGIFCRMEYVKDRGLRMFQGNLYKDLFNACAYALCAATAGLLYRIASRYFSLMIGKLNVMGILAATAAYVMVNVLIYNALMAMIEERKIKEVLLGELWVVRNMLAIAPLGIIVALAYLSFGKFVVVLFFVPLLLARYSFKLYLDMRRVYFETIQALSNAMEAKDKYTNGHSYRVADYAVGIAESMGLSGKAIEQIRTAAILHDIGKIGVADAILNKPGKLEENEYQIIQRHPEMGAKILSEVDFLADVSRIIKYHHERFDGKGYPEGLGGAKIPIEAAILAVADAYDAMTSDRPYRKAMDPQIAMKILWSESGRQFNPIVVKAFQDYLYSQREVVSHVS